MCSTLVNAFLLTEDTCIEESGDKDESKSDIDYGVEEVEKNKKKDEG